MRQIAPQLHRWAYGFSPRYSLESPTETADPRTRYWGINWDIEGCVRLFKGESALLATIRAQLLSHGIRSRAAIAPTLGAAWALSRYGAAETAIIQNDSELRQALALLPVAALRISPTTITALKELNITRIEQLFSLPRKALLARFDRELLTRFDQVFGRVEEPIFAAHPEPTPRVERIFDGPLLTQESLLCAIEELLARLLQGLAAAEKLLAHLVLELTIVGAPITREEIRLSVPSSRKEHLWSLLKPRLEKLQMGFGVEAIRLSAPHTEQARGRSTGFTEEPAEEQLWRDHSFGELLDTLTSRLGRENVVQLECKESHIPERAYGYRPFMKRHTRIAPDRVETGALVETQRPSLLFYKPQPIQAMSLLPDSPPVWLRWRGKAYSLTQGVGPERIAPEWWGKDAGLCLTRDYFKVQLPSGTWLWIFRYLENNEWFLHGIWA